VARSVPYSITIWLGFLIQKPTTETWFTVLEMVTARLISDSLHNFWLYSEIAL
jgi:hypothetical protein